MNQMQLIGHVGQNPILKQVGDKRVAKFSLAVNRRFGNDQETLWFQIEAWNGLADTIMEHVVSGKELFVDGPVNVDAYINKEGKAIPVVTITLKTFYFCGKKDKPGDSQLQVTELATKRSRK